MNRSPARAPDPSAAARAVSHPHDPAEREAQRAADVVARGGSVAGWSFAALPLSAPAPVQRQEVPSPDAEREEAVKKTVEALLEVPKIKAVKDEVIGKLTGTPLAMTLTGTALAGGITGLALAGKELPIPLPELAIPGHPDILAKLTVAGPLNAPTEVGLTLTFREKVKKPARRRAGPVQRAATPSASATPRAARVDAALEGPGRPLDRVTRRGMEERLGHDLSRVRVHDDARAAETAAGIDAAAFTVGEHVVFGAGRYAPASGDGRRLLAHELVHVVQQTRPPAARGGGAA